ncbi:MAG: hypothetical protein HY287_06910 [Planctomycetes bacterium]|nr:hypothetical protein [Planctomycetota bacterium]MBI3834044.1 hypothetical protein [Planctomycetota bacterium]
MAGSPRSKILLIVGGFIAGIAVTVFLMREPTGTLTAAALQTARDHWRNAGVKNYDMTYRMHGNMYEIRVRGGIVADVRVNNLAPNSADWKAYSVDGLFDVLALDLETFRSPANQADGPTAIMRVRFHPQLGYIEHYVRSGSTATDATIETLSFSLCDESKNSS